jgi:hypothetical protein
MHFKWFLFWWRYLAPQSWDEKQQGFRAWIDPITPQSRTGTELLPGKEEHNNSEFPGTYKSWSIPSNPIHKPLISHYDPLDDLRGNPIVQLQSAQPKHSGLQICLKASETSHAPKKLGNYRALTLEEAPSTSQNMGNLWKCWMCFSTKRAMLTVL